MRDVQSPLPAEGGIGSKLRMSNSTFQAHNSAGYVEINIYIDDEFWQGR
jgi:hypothetical protein